MSDNDHRKRGLDDSDNHGSDSEDRRHKRVAVPDELSESQERPLHRRRDEDVKMKGEGEDNEVTSMAIRALVSMKEAGVIIGKSGKNVNEIREQSGAKVTISDITPGAIERVMTISGPLDMVAKAYALVARKIIVEQREQDDETSPEAKSAVVQVLVPHHIMGVVIGKSGTKIREIQEASAARLQASEEMLPGSTDRTVTITGVPDSIHIAVYHIGAVFQEKSNNDRERENRSTSIQYRPVPRNSYPGPPGYPPLGPPPPSSHHRHRQPHQGHQGYYGGGGGGYMHGPYGLDYMPTSAGGAAVTQAQQIFIPNDMVGTVIGKSGAKINEIRQMSGSHIKIADAPGAGNGRLVTITGTPESNQMAVYLLYSRLESQKADHNGKRG
ncbi:hypothetical protein BGZ58_001834 [Dissophora ornata]|nr:hypothetical protein BGZ58_001834 [Dissophora ornata]